MYDIQPPNPTINPQTGLGTVKVTMKQLSLDHDNRDMAFKVVARTSRYVHVSRVCRMRVVRVLVHIENRSFVSTRLLFFTR
jgi:hypothetical protein